MRNKILSIQSRLVYGYVGSNIAELAIQLHGLDVISFPTVLLATHTGHRPIYGCSIDNALFRQLVDGIEAIDVLESTSCIVTGYMGNIEVLKTSSNFIQKIKAKYPDQFYICDPVMGDRGEGLYVSDDIANGMLEYLIPNCDILTPNHFELEHIVQHKVDTIDELVSLVAASALLKDKIVVTTSCLLKDTPIGYIETVIVQGDRVERVTAPFVDVDAVGTGDLFAAIVASRLAKGEDIVSAVRKASTIICHTLDRMIAKGRDEMDAECLLHSIVG